MRLGEFLAAAMVIGGLAGLLREAEAASIDGLVCRVEAPAALALFGRVGERFLASLPR
jgi:hypothetical protein